MVCRCLGRHSRVAIAAPVCTLRDQELFARVTRTCFVACSRLSSRSRLRIGGMTVCDYRLRRVRGSGNRDRLPIGPCNAASSN